ncbi:relaxase/mobilization nuclease domain-containing protein [Algoriphagus sp. PAP.12]|uniref:relaxase/mobilization nuclease domain-containing protein n=1 Tax=Algoriphagus sp. PAP.12 TaxID=2996678 RepID=UPI00227A19C4|nr:relaxase/mobilization nuclease domain-containing protein [Algoriphagus sp. PAP.12]
MVAILNNGSSIARPVQYNENKLKEGTAVFLSAVNYPGNSTGDSPDLRKKYLVKITGLNPRKKINSVHVSLNFSPDDTLEKDRLIQISKEYMKGIGFGEQPFLIYQHLDAGHPHLHLVTTNIQLDGKAISLHYLVNLKSIPTCKAIENRFGLVKAGEQKPAVSSTKRVDLSPLEYGNSEMRKGIGNILQSILKNYSYTSLEELNAVLKGYNVVADRGKEGSMLYERRGLCFRILNKKGQKIGTPIKSSLFHFKATLAGIESRFAENEKARKFHESALKSTIDLTLFKSPNLRIEDWIQRLDKQGVVVVKIENQEGRLVGLTYVDHRTKCVFNGSSLGKDYIAKALVARLGMEPNQMNQLEYSRTAIDFSEEKARASEQKNTSDTLEKKGYLMNPDNPLLTVSKLEESSSNIPLEWKKRKRRKKKGISTS